MFVDVFYPKVLTPDVDSAGWRLEPASFADEQNVEYSTVGVVGYLAESELLATMILENGLW